MPTAPRGGAAPRRARRAVRSARRATRAAAPCARREPRECRAASRPTRSRAARGRFPQAVELREHVDAADLFASFAVAEVGDELGQEGLVLAVQLLRPGVDRNGRRQRGRLGLPAEHPAPPRSRCHDATLPDVDLVAISDDPIAADQLDAKLAERLAVERDLAARATAEQRAAALEHDVEAEPRPVRATCARPRRLRPARRRDRARWRPQHERAGVLLEPIVHSSPRPNLPAPTSGTVPTSGSPASDVPLRESRSRSRNEPSLRAISACCRDTPPARSGRSHSASRPITIFGAAHATASGLPRRRARRGRR